MAEIVNVKGARSIHVKTTFGEPVVANLKDLGAKWDEETRTWKLSKKHATALKSLLARASNTPEALAAGRLELDRKNILGRAKVGFQSYYIVGQGSHETRGEWLRLMFLDGSKTFFKAADEVEIVTWYEKPHTLAGLQAYAERRKREAQTGICECWCHESAQCDCPSFCSFHHDGCDSCGCER